jgi:hypothetical protein
MRQWMNSVAMCFALVLASWASTADARPIVVKAGGGALLSNDVRPGMFASIEIPISEDYPTHLSPFVEFYSKDGTHMIPLGVSPIYKASFSERGGTVFFGANGGVLMIRGDPGLGYATGTSGMIGVSGGLSFGLGDRLGVFVLGRWLRPFEDETADNELGAHVGLQFDLGG